MQPQDNSILIIKFIKNLFLFETFKQLKNLLLYLSPSNISFLLSSHCNFNQDKSCN